MQWRAAEELLSRNKSHFATASTILGTTGPFEATIPTTTDFPPGYQRHTRTTPLGHETISKNVQQMLEKQVIQPSQSPWASPVVLVRKKSGEMRFCIDYRLLNSVTIRDVYPLPHVQDILSSLGKAKFFSSLDLHSGYWQIPIAAKDRFKTAFATRDGLYEFIKLPFGLTNAPSIFQRIMNQVLHGLTWRYCLVYLDDVLVFSETFEEHLVHLQAIFDRLGAANLKLRGDKCTFFAKELHYLGHIVSDKGLQVDPDKVRRVTDMPSCKDVEDVRVFLGLAGFYRRFIQRFAEIAAPLNKLLRKDVEWRWGSAEEAAQRALCKALASAPILAQPDFSKPFQLETDASKNVIGAILSQPDDSGPNVIGFWSRAMNRAECNYGMPEKECLAIVSAIEHFRPYLETQPFKVLSDHKALQDAFGKKTLSARLARWIMRLQPFKFSVAYRRGELSANADATTRGPIAHLSLSEATDSKDLTLKELLADMYHFADCLRNAEIEHEIATIWKRNVCDLFAIDDLPTETTAGSSSLLADDTATLSPARIRSAQLADKELAPFMRNALMGPQLPNNPFFLDDNQVLRRHTWVEHEVRPLIVLPASLRPEVMRVLHDDPTSGHSGIKRTYDSIRRRFWWFGMASQITKYVNSCNSCQASNTPARPTQGLLQPIVTTEPWELLGIDVVGPLPTTKRGHRFIVTFVDHFSGYPFAFATRDHTAKTIARLLLDNIVPLIGCKPKFLTDRGQDFLSKIIQEVIQILESRKLSTSGWRPQTNGATEHFHNPFIRMIKHFCNEKQTDWDDYIPFALLAYRSSRHSAHRYTPSEVAFGFQLQLPIDAVSAAEKGVQMPVPKEIFVQQALERWQTIKTFVNRYRIFARETNRERYDANAAVVEYQVGQLVWLYVPSVQKSQTKKLTKLWRGPFRIVGRRAPVLYQLSVPRQRRILKQWVHVQRLKPYISRFEEPVAPATIVDNSDLFDPDVEGDLSNSESLPDRESMVTLEAGRTPPLTEPSAFRVTRKRTRHGAAESGPVRSSIASPFTSDAHNSSLPSVVPADVPLDAPTIQQHVHSTDASDNFPDVPLDVAPHVAEDFDGLSDLYDVLEHLRAHISDNARFALSRAKSQLKDLLGEGSLFVRSTARQREFQRQVRLLKDRSMLLDYLKDLLTNFAFRFAYELALLQNQHNLKQARDQANLVLCCFDLPLCLHLC